MQVRTVPKPQIIAKGSKPKLIPGGFLHMRLRKQLPELENIIIDDQQYLYITREWFFQLKNWTDRFIEQQVPGLLSSKKAKPVDYNLVYTEFMSSVANISVAKHYNVKGSVLIGIVVAKNVEPWGKIPASGEPMSYVGVLTKDGGLVYDLETDQLVDLFKFPNFKHITKLVF